MRSRFDEQLALLNKEMIEMGALCEKVISLAVDALENGDSEAASKVSPFDSEIDEKERTIEALFSTAEATRATDFLKIWRIPL